MPSALEEEAGKDPTVLSILQSGRSHAETIEELRRIGVETSRTSIKRFRRGGRENSANRRPVPQVSVGPQAPVGRAEITPDAVTFQGVVVDKDCQRAQDWGPIFAIFGLDPDEFEIVDDTVRISTWQQSKRLENGARDVVQLWAHSARFRRRLLTDIRESVVNSWRRALQIDERVAPKTVTSAASGTYLCNIADPQLGKKGTEEAVSNWKRAVRSHAKEIENLGDAVGGIHVAFQGDETEGFANNYGNQQFTIEMNKSSQLELDFDLRVFTIREFAKLGLPMSASSVISNHGEWTRNGSKDVLTTKGDNSSTHIARQVKKLFDEVEQFGGAHIDWSIGDGDPGVLVNLSGVETYFSHGYIEKGRGVSVEARVKGAIERQILGRTETLGTVPLWIMAHYHHFHAQEFEGRTLFGCPALEAERSSEYMLNQYGVWSPPGALGMLVGTDYLRGWSHVNIY